MNARSAPRWPTRSRACSRASVRSKCWRSDRSSSLGSESPASASSTSASAVRDVADIQDHLGRQNEILKNVGEKFAADVRTMLELGKTFGEEAQQIARDGVSGMKGGNG